MSIADVKPTRSELIATRRRIKLSISGHKLLKMKRDGLIMEFFELPPKVKDMRAQLSGLYGEAVEMLAVAMAADGKSALSSALTAGCSRGDMRYAVNPTSNGAAASAAVRPVGRGCRFSSGTATTSAKPPRTCSPSIR